MSIEVKPGRWRMRGGEIAIVADCCDSVSLPWLGRLANHSRMRWAPDGRFLMPQGPYDLVEYLGPEEPQATS